MWIFLLLLLDGNWSWKMWQDRYLCMPILKWFAWFHYLGPFGIVGLIDWALKEEAEGKKTKKDDAAEQVWQGRTGSWWFLFQYFLSSLSHLVGTFWCFFGLWYRGRPRHSLISHTYWPLWMKLYSYDCQMYEYFGTTCIVGLMMLLSFMNYDLMNCLIIILQYDLSVFFMFSSRSPAHGEDSIMAGQPTPPNIPPPEIRPY